MLFSTKKEIVPVKSIVMTPSLVSSSMRGIISFENIVKLLFVFLLVQSIRAYHSGLEKASNFGGDFPRINERVTFHATLSSRLLFTSALCACVRLCRIFYKLNRGWNTFVLLPLKLHFSCPLYRGQYTYYSRHYTYPVPHIPQSVGNLSTLIMLIFLLTRR